jgi:hypothetical protein
MTEKNKKPLYINEYIFNEDNTNTNNKSTSYLFFLFIITLFVFLPSIIDIIFSYLDIDKCQEIEYITTLNKWLRFLGAYSLVYYTFIFLTIYFLYINNNKENYTRMYNVNDRNNRERNGYFFKFFLCIFTVFMLIIQSFVTYAYFQYFNNYCDSYTIIIYMWIRLITGILSSLFIVVNISYMSIDI